MNEIGNSLPKEEASTDETASSDTTEEITTAIAEENSAMEEAEMRDSKEQAKARAEYKKAEEERNRRKWMSLGMIGVASLFVVAGGFFIFFKKKD